MNKQELLSWIESSRNMIKKLDFTDVSDDDRADYLQTVVFKLFVEAEKMVNGLTEPQKVKVPVYVVELLDYYRESTDVDLLALLITFKDWYYRTDKDSKHEKAIEWLVKRPEKYMRAWMDGYEIEQEPKWVIRSNEDESSYLTEFEITPKHGVRELWGHKYEASQLSDKDLAQYTAYVVDGTAELVEVAE